MSQPQTREAIQKIAEAAVRSKAPVNDDGWVSILMDEIFKLQTRCGILEADLAQLQRTVVSGGKGGPDSVDQEIVTLLIESKIKLNSGAVAENLDMEVGVVSRRLHALAQRGLVIIHRRDGRQITFEAMKEVTNG